MAKKKNGRIAVPFLITIFIGLLIIGGAAIFIYNYFELGKEDALSEPIARSVDTASYEDNNTILLILDTPEEKSTSTFVLMRALPKDKKLLFVGIPTNTISLVDGQQAKLKDTYDRGGPSSAVNFTEQAFGIEIDRYMKFDSTAFLKICDIIGGVSYAVNVDIIGFEKTDSEQYLNGQQIQTLLTYSMFENGEVQRAYTASSLLAAMINQSDGQRLADSFDRNFTTIINLVDSDITAVDYKNHKTAIKYMFERGTSIARFRIIDGTNSGNDFIPSESFAPDMIKEYFTTPDETSSESSKSK